jgi:hypothetical protein
VAQRVGPEELTGVGARIHTMARDAGQSQVTEWVTRLFGHATCPECGTRFVISESVIDQ